MTILKITNFKSMINVGIIGCGFVGGALKDWLEHNNPECSGSIPSLMLMNTASNMAADACHPRSGNFFPDLV